MPESTQVIIGLNRSWILKDPLDNVENPSDSEVWTAYDFSMYLEKAGLNPESISINPMTRLRFLQECVIIFKEPEYAVRFLKNPDPTAIAKFSMDVEALMSLDDPRIAKIHDHKMEMTIPQPPENVNETDEQKEEREKGIYPPFYIIDRIDGDTMKELAEEEKAYKGKIHESLVLMKEIGLALVKAHNAGIIHSDLNPKKVFIKNDGSPVIIDFSICNFKEGRFCSLTGDVRDDCFVSPELVRSPVAEGELCATNDVYSFGKLLYYLISGGRELPGEFHNEVDFDLRIKDPSRSMKLAYRIFDKTITGKPDDRMQSIDELLTMMDSEMQEGTTCIFCNKGKYRPISRQGREKFWPNIVLPTDNDYNPRLLVCDNCGNVQKFLDSKILQDDSL